MIEAKAGPEKKEFESIAACRAAFASGLVKMLPPGTSLPPGYDLNPAPIAPDHPEPTPSGSAALLSIDTLSDPQWVASQKGFVTGKMVFEKALGPNRGLFCIQGIDRSGVQLVEHDLGFEVPRLVTMPLEQILKHWTVFKGDLPAKLDMQLCASRTLATSEHIRLERQRAALFNIMVDMANEREAKFQVAFCVSPSEARVLHLVPKGKLELIPATDLKAISTKPSAGACEVRLNSDLFWLSEPSRPRSAQSAGWRQDSLMVPFWWVVSSNNKEEANLMEKAFTCQKHGVTFKGLVNSRALKVNERLVLYKPKKEVVSLSAASSVKRARAA